MSNVNAGTYKAAAVPVEANGKTIYAQFGLTKGGDGKEPKKQVAVQFEIIEGPAMGSKLTWFGYFTDKTWNKTVEALRCCGFKGDDLYQIESQTLDQEVSIVVEPNTWEGKTTMRIAWVNAASSGIKLANPMGSDDLRRFAATMKSRVAQVKPVEGKKAEKSAAQPATANDEPTPPDDSEEVPF
jgi:hypothetical protein